MIWNLFMHIMIGLLGTQHFDLTGKGILFCILITSFTQASEMVRLSMEEKKRLAAVSESEREESWKIYKKEIPGQFAQNLLLYSAVVLFSAEVGRTTGYGI